MRDFPVAKVKNVNSENVFQRPTPFSQICPSSVRNHLERGTLPGGKKGTKRRNDDSGPPHKKPFSDQREQKCKKCGGKHLTKNCRRAHNKRLLKEKERERRDKNLKPHPKTTKNQNKDRQAIKKE